ncbi:sodium/calcium exchanger 2-like isoform X2 [Neocloeon triangulifer]|uniref:sodium/calcium exchanger 2-like isoform X2 n=1 Tax=Neocloeon triangulifer TaxID=2078957 RepID=UPI00286F21C8|nr:sodium/calcium exchanger 2-like isoform X2 [Neocloeon triangulifer]
MASINATDLEKLAQCPPGLLLPFLEESHWSVGLRATLYIMGLLYCFLGIAIVADVFMGAIEIITSKTRKVYLASNTQGQEPDVVEVRIWNDTVANLTLMALGSSAPEILLSCIEIVGKNFEAGELGPGTIVGSAAFNLLIISAVCVGGIPEGETRTIRMIKVFGVTTIFSLLAYIWLLVIVAISSPGIVEVWESVVTFMLFPALVLVAFATDRGFICGVTRLPGQKQIELEQPDGDKMITTRGFFKNGVLEKDSLVAFVKEVKKYPGLSDEDAALLAAQKLVESQPHSKMWYRIGAVRNLSGGRKTQLRLTKKLKEKLDSRLKLVYDTINEHPEAPNLGPIPETDLSKAIIEFHAATCAVAENIGKFPITIVRHGKMDETVKVRIESIDGTATEIEDYIPVNEVITFEPNEMRKTVNIEIVDDNQWEPDEEFFLKLSLIPTENNENVQLGHMSIMEITILNDDEPGVLSFNKRGILVQESIGMARIPVVRTGGADGEVSVKWRTKDKSAFTGKDFRGGEGTLTFGHTETERILEIPIIDDMEPEKDEHFEVELFEPTGGAKLGSIPRMAVTITNDDAYNSITDHLMKMTHANMDAMRTHQDTWANQIRDAMNVNGGDLANATNVDYLMHFLTFGWKIIFSLIPPPSLLGGWPCFFFSLAMIGVITAVVGDLASIFGCLVGLEDSVTAITLVAMGTSLPDTFASKAAAMQEKYADNAIGNITGSNSVNVFLGLGLPWMMAALYHWNKGTTFFVPSAGLGFSVCVFTLVAVLAVMLLMVRRHLSLFGKAELGGPFWPRVGSVVFLVGLWFLYVTLSSLQAYDVIKVQF